MEMPSWTVQQKQRLKAVWGTMTAGQIAHDPTFKGRTRNAILGAAHRLGLTKIEKHLDVDPHKNKRPRTRSTSDTAMTLAREPKPKKAKPLDLDRMTIIVREAVRPCTLLDLNAKTCRWPVADDERGIAGLFCGLPPLDGVPYCAIHCRMAYHHQREETTT